MDLPRGTYLGDKVSSNGSSWHRSASEGLGPSWHPSSRADRPRYLDDFILRCKTSRASNLDHPRVLMRISYSRKLPPFHDMMLSLIDCLRLLPPTSETPLPGTSRRQVAPSLLGFLCHVTGAFTKVYTKIWGPSTFNPVDVRNSAAGKLWIPSAPKKAPIN